MTSRFVKCEYCRVELPSETCKLAAYTTIIDGKEYTFCCVKCAQRYKQKKGRTK